MALFVLIIGGFLGVVTKIGAIYTGISRAMVKLKGHEKWATSQQRGILSINPADLANYDFATASMRPKVNAAQQFAEKTGKVAAIGSLEELEKIVKGTAGTRVTRLVGEMERY